MPRPPSCACTGFASSCRDNWVNTGWVRDLTRAGFRVLGVDQRGHGARASRTIRATTRWLALVGDLLTVLDTYLLDSVLYAGYSLGGRVGWQLFVDSPDRVRRGILGGIPDGRPLARLKIEQAKAYADSGMPIDDRVTQNYVTLAERVPGNDLRVLIALAEGMRLGDSDPDPSRPPQQPVLFATGAKTRSSSARGTWPRPLRGASSSRSPAGTTSTRRVRARSARPASAFSSRSSGGLA